MRRNKAKATAVARSERNSLPFISLALLTALAALMLAGCNTVSGMGEDISAAGGAIQQTSQGTEDRIDDSDSRRR